MMVGDVLKTELPFFDVCVANLPYQVRYTSILYRSAPALSTVCIAIFALFQESHLASIDLFLTCYDASVFFFLSTVSQKDVSKKNNLRSV